MPQDLVINGRSNGGMQIAAQMEIPEMDFDSNLFRPILVKNKQGQYRDKVLVMNVGGKTEYNPKTQLEEKVYKYVNIKAIQDELGFSHPVWNATTALRKEE